MANMDVLMPKMGESVAEATVIKWLKQPGDAIEADEPIMEIATDKVDSEIPSPIDGVLAEQCCAEGDVVQVGARVAVINTEAGAQSSASESPSAPAVEAAATAPVAASTAQVAVGDIPKHSESGRFYSPLGAQHGQRGRGVHFRTRGDFRLRQGWSCDQG
jgi:2-oxoglutarate dehydrogenase E2 component (dihydrolipoamide succinyltransferase)